FVVLRGRDYYQAPAYPILLAAGAVWMERWMRSRKLRAIVWTAMIVNAVVGVILLLPIAPVNSRLWNVAAAISGDVKEELGWPELVETVAKIRDSLSAEDRVRLGILTGNYGEAGAINLYGVAY